MSEELGLVTVFSRKVDLLRYQFGIFTVQGCGEIGMMSLKRLAVMRL